MSVTEVRAWCTDRGSVVRRTLERPLTSYYLLLGGTIMLLAIG